MMTEPADDYLKPTEKTVLKGYKECRDFVRANFDEFKWAFSNLSGQQKYAVWAILTFSGRCWQLLGLDQGAEEAGEIQKKWREENQDWFNGKYRSAKLVALVDTFHRFNIDQRYLVEMLEGVESWISKRKFETREDFNQFATRMGGPVIEAIAQIVDIEHGTPESVQEKARKIGRVIAISQMLSRLPRNLKRGRVFLPADELNENGIRVSDLCVGRGGPGFNVMIKQIVADAKEELMEGATILNDLSFDGQRVMKSLLSMTLRVLEKIDSEQDAILERPVVLTLGEQFKFQLKHILGLEGSKEFDHLIVAHH